MLEAIDLTKRFGTTSALEGLNLCVPKGEMYCLLGANGAGKTTTLNLFLGFSTPTKGTARVAGLSVSTHPAECRRQVAYVPEVATLYAEFTARENLEFFTRLNGMRLQHSELDAVMQQAGLEAHAFDRRVRTFSKGMRQKLVLAIAISKATDALLLDEPTSGLDPLATAELTRVLTELRDKGRAILLSSHDLFRCWRIADRIGILRSGRLVAEYTREQLTALDLEDVYLAHMDVEARINQ